MAWTGVACLGHGDEGDYAAVCRLRDAPSTGARGTPRIGAAMIGLRRGLPNCIAVLLPSRPLLPQQAWQ
jgi:hypothetical protein